MFRNIFARDYVTKDFLHQEYKRKRPQFQVVPKRIGNGHHHPKMAPLISSLQFHMNQLCRDDNYSRVLTRKMPYGEVTVHRVKDLVEIIDARYWGGGFIILLHQELGIVTIFNWEGMLVKKIQLLNPVNSPWTASGMDDFIALHGRPSLAPAEYPYGNSDDWTLYWLYALSMIKPPYYIMAGDNLGFCSLCGDWTPFTDTGSLGYGYRYDWSGTFKYGVDLRDTTLGPYRIRNRWWYTHSKDSNTNYAILIQKWEGTVAGEYTETTFVILYSVHPTTYAYTQVGYVATPEVHWIPPVEYSGDSVDIVRYNIDCVSMEDDCFYVHFVEAEWHYKASDEWGIGEENPYITDGCEYVRKYDYTTAELLRSGVHNIPATDYYGYIGPVTYGTPPVTPEAPYNWGDVHFLLGYSRLYSGDYVVYSNYRGLYQASWDASDLSYRSSGLTPATSIGEPYGHRTLPYLGCKNSSVYMGDSMVYGDAPHEVTDYSCFLVDKYNFDSDEDLTYNYLMRTYCDYRENLIYRETPLAGFVMDGLQLF